MKAEGSYARVEGILRARGFYTSIQPLTSEGGVRLVCATDGGSWGIGGISFWVTLKRQVWFIATWAPHIYQVPANTDIVDVIIAALDAALRSDIRNYYVIDEEVVASFALEEIGLLQFDKLDQTD